MSAEPPLTLFPLFGLLILSDSWRKGRDNLQSPPLPSPKPPPNSLQSSNLPFLLSFLSVRAKQKMWINSMSQSFSGSLRGFGKGNKMGTEYKTGWEELELSLFTGWSQGQLLFERVALPQIKDEAKRTNGEGFPVSGQGQGRLENIRTSGKDSV